jgi:hypothetical protein
MVMGDTMRTTISKPRRRESGTALLIAVLLLLLLALLGFAALDTVKRDQEVAGFQNRSSIAFFAADAGIAKGLETLTTTQTPSVPVTTLGDAGIFPHGGPSFRPDPTATDPIDRIGSAAYPGMSMNIGQGGSPTYQLSYWRIRVQGEGPAGTVSRSEVVAGALLAN